MFFNSPLEPQQHIGPWLFQIMSFEGIHIGSQIWYYLSLRNISWFYISYLVALDDDNLVISGYNLVRSSHPSNTKPRSVCLYYKNYLLVRVLSIIYLNECLNIELIIGDKSRNFVAFYRSSSQSKDNSEAFLIILKWKVLF